MRTLCSFTFRLTSNTMHPIQLIERGDRPIRQGYQDVDGSQS